VIHRLLDVPGGRIHLVEQGSGPLVLLIHGFPESWYSWRHQLPALAAAGYRAVAIDVRGYGRSSRPQAVEAYRMLAHVADNVAVLRALGEETAKVVGHDWGSPIAATSALLRPDRFTAAALLSVPFTPPGGPRPTEAFARVGGDDEFYISYFQSPGRAEAEIEPDVRGWLTGFYAALAGAGEPWFLVAPGGRLSDRFPAEATLPDWLDLDPYVEEFERTGFTGALNRYRNVDRDWEDLAAWDGEPLRVPSLFIGGSLDATTTWMAEAVAAHPDKRILDGCGHWIQQQRPDEVNALLIEWLARS
jgi:pimeloyl-ACP methyl ester carboxylesterase